VEDAIAKGGTRMAAKRGSRRGGTGGGQGNGNGGRKGSQRTGGVPEEVRRAILEGPPRTMLVTSREDRTQIAVLEDRTVVEHYVTRKEDVTFVGNIYMARVQNVLPGMEAAFLDIGKGRNGVLYAGEVLYDELDLEEGEAHRIENALKPGQKVLVQVTKDPMGSKGPRLTMHLSLAGRYMVLAPSSDLFGISRKLTDRERDRLRRVVKKVKPSEHGVIVRTAAEGATEEQIIADLQRLLVKWERVEKAAEEAKALTAVYEEPPLVVKVIRDNFGPEFARCIVDDEDLYRQVQGYLDEVAPELLDKVELYGAPTADARSRAAGAPPLEPDVSPRGSSRSDGSDQAIGDATADTTTDDVDPTIGRVDLAAAASRREELPPLFAAYDVADQLRKAMSKKVWLPSGGYLIIESTEAMKVIDVNTGRFTGDKDLNLEEIVLRTNLEAADEIVRQLRLRDMGGIIVIDFIDMLLKANQEQVVRRLKRELLRDRTKTRVSEVSRLGLVQMTRKNVSQGLLESFSHTCEACEGRGVISELE
jgi:ribonuclease E